MRRAPIVWHTEVVRVGDIAEWAENPRAMTKREADDLGISIEEFGYADILVLNADRTVIGGHMRLRTMIDRHSVHPDSTIEVRMPNRQLTEREHAELAIRLNKNSGHWDYEKLANEFDSADLISWGFLPSELSLIDTGNSVADELSGDGALPTLSTQHEPGLTRCPSCGYTFDTKS